MALNIPMPDLPGTSFLKGLDTGSDMFQRMMQPVIEREKLKQQQDEFLQTLALKKQALGQKYAKNAYDNAMMQQLMKAFSPSSTGSPPPTDSQSNTATPNPTLTGSAVQPASSPVDVSYTPATPQGQAVQSTLQQLGMPSDMKVPVDLSTSDTSQQNGVQPSAPQANVVAPSVTPRYQQNLDVFKQNPILRGYFKHKFGFDPLSSTVYTGAAREAMDLENLKQQVGENSPVYQNALASFNAKLTNEQALKQTRERTLAGLKPGETQFFDPQSGAPIGKEVPYTEKERQSEEGNILFNTLYPYVYKGAAPFSGEGSITRLQQAAANYKTDPKARQMFDDFLLSNKLMAATVVNEASTLKARSTNSSYNMLKSSLEAQDIPNVVTKLIKEYNIPASAQLTAAMRYQKILSDARQKAAKGVPATKKLFYDPKQQAAYDQQQDQMTISNSGQNDEKNVIVIDPYGKKYKTTEDNAANLPEGWKRG
jgi:hypothetical protein